MIRLFAAIPVPEGLGRRLQALQAGVEGARWRPLEALHVTLRFFGDVREDMAEDLDLELAAIAGKPFELAIGGVGAFGEGHRVHAIWAGVTLDEPLRILAERCERAARRAGLEPDKRRYHPHVTLAYLKDPAADAVAAWIQAGALLKLEPFRVEGFSLYSSRLLAGGSRYDIERLYRF